MTDYTGSTHAQMYAFVWSGDPDSLRALAARLAAHHAAVDDATTGLQNQLSIIYRSWQGLAADRFKDRFSSTLRDLRQHAESAEQTGRAVGYAADALYSARTQMPQPPDGLEEFVAGIGQNALTAAAAQVLTGGIANSLSASAQQDIQVKHGHATNVMTQLAAAYGHARAQLPQGAETGTAGAGKAAVGQGEGTGGGTSLSGAGAGLGAFAASGAAGLAAGVLGARMAGDAPGLTQSTEYDDTAGLDSRASSGGGEPGASAAEGAAGAEGAVGELEQMAGASGRGLGAFGRAQERGQRSAAVKEDAGTWVCAAHEGALPPGGLIE